MAMRWYRKFKKLTEIGDTSPSLELSTSLRCHDTINDQTRAKLVSHSYQEMTPLELNGDVDAFLDKIMYMIPRISPNIHKRSDVVIFDIIYDKCSETVQNLILSNCPYEHHFDVSLRNTKALLKFLVNSVGQPFDPLKNLSELRSLKPKIKWKDAILFTQHYLNRWFDQVSASPDIITRHLIYKREILSMCGFETQRKLRFAGLLRPTELAYEAFCNALKDYDDTDDVDLQRHHSNLCQLVTTDQALAPESVTTVVPYVPVKKETGPTVLPSNKGKSRQRTFKCSVCKSNSHSFILCHRIRWQVRLKPLKTRVNAKTSANQTCLKCLEFGHTAKYCDKFAWVVFRSK